MIQILTSRIFSCKKNNLVITVGEERKRELTFKLSSLQILWEKLKTIKGKSRFLHKINFQQN